jgi:preprotein translocase subunit SecG
VILVFYTVHVALSLFLILVVLLQQGKGADLSVFGGGASQAAFGARGAATLLHKLTVVCFVLFIMTTLTINIVQKQGTSSVMSGVDSVMDEVEAAAPAAPADEPEAAPAEDGESAEPGAGDGSGTQG